ncbi:hypothetical protein LU631_15890 [Erwinia tracheiphila]|nr:hypothetical protein [Erwinia tracheiphila]MCW1874819.1 hypothetical protein [Erwinia sp. INIA01]UIA85682.1 hypothetical protein LU604_11345 [Erwinia tracheiphila]UIA90108.1 hypothetical protein LU631_15890 [Erwinia tracheiphila]UIA94209.1 hypothetical protein LU632_10910 [Erwinia tracheiphila]UIA98632.1 hypothetical protein LU633_14350 [Erwinia tracheiphila]
MNANFRFFFYFST